MRFPLLAPCAQSHYSLLAAQSDQLKSLGAHCINKFLNIIIKIKVNRGYAYYNDNLVEYGMPFIAVFDKSNGNQKYLVETGRKKQMINSYMLNKDSAEIFLVMDNKLSRYSLNDGKLINGQPFDSHSSLSLSNTALIAHHCR